jgi:tetratricopeptide (TPR) repeat protein
VTTESQIEDPRRWVFRALAFVLGASAEAQAAYRQVLANVQPLVDAGRGDFDVLERRLADLRALRDGASEQVATVQPVLAVAGVADHETVRLQSERLLRWARATFEMVLGPGCLEVALVAHELGRLLAAGGRHEAALACYQEALRVRRSAVDPIHPDVAAVLHDMALLLEGQGRGEEAAALWAEAEGVLEAAR